MMWMILQHDTKPEDWVIATGITTSIRDFVKMYLVMLMLN